MFLLQPDNETVRLASMVARQANICAVRLLKIDGESDHDPASGAIPSNPTASFQIVDTDLTRPGLVRVTCTMDVSVDWFLDEGSRREGHSEWSLTYVADYIAPAGEMPDEIRTRAIPAFAQVNVPYNLWPYFRQAIQSSASEMGIVGLVLPPLRYEPRTADK